MALLNSMVRDKHASQESACIDFESEELIDSAEERSGQIRNAETYMNCHTELNNDDFFNQIDSNMFNQIQTEIVASQFENRLAGDFPVTQSSPFTTDLEENINYYQQLIEHRFKRIPGPLCEEENYMSSDSEADNNFELGQGNAYSQPLESPSSASNFFGRDLDSRVELFQNQISKTSPNISPRFTEHLIFDKQNLHNLKNTIIEEESSQAQSDAMRNSIIAATDFVTTSEDSENLTPSPVKLRKTYKNTNSLLCLRGDNIGLSRQATDSKLVTNNPSLLLSRQKVADDNQPVPMSITKLFNHSDTKPACSS